MQKVTFQIGLKFLWLKKFKILCCWHVINYLNGEESVETYEKNRKKQTIFGAGMSSTVHIDNKNKDILILREGPTQGLDNITFKAEAKYPIDFTESEKRFVLSLHYNGSNSFLFVNATKIYQFKAKDSKIKPYPLCLGNISKCFTIDNMKKNPMVKRKCGILFSVNYRPTNTNKISDIHRFLMKET